jgi:carnosine N-methyltransferase
LTHRRRTAFYALPQTHQSLLSSPPISYLKSLNLLDEAIEANALLAEAIFRSATDAFGIDLEKTGGGKKVWGNSASNEDLDKVRSTLKQFYRDWSQEGKEEREACYGPVMKELEERFGEKEKYTSLVERKRGGIMADGGARQT